MLFGCEKSSPQARGTANSSRQDASQIGSGPRVLVPDGPEPADVIVLDASEQHAEAIALYGFALARTGRDLEAVAPLRRALRETPSRGDVRRELARILADTGSDRDAARLLRDGMALQPNGVRTAFALAWLLATSPDADVRDGARAVHLAERWLKAPGPKGDGTRLDILACAYAEAHRAIALALQADKPDLAAAMTARQELFERGQPYRAGRNVRK